MKDGYHSYACSFEKDRHKRLNAQEQPNGLYLSGAIDTKRRKFVMVGDGVFTVGPEDGQLTALVTHNPPPLAAGMGSPGVAYDPIADRIVIWKGGRDVWTLNVDTGEWTQVARSMRPANNSQSTYGTFGRCAFVPADRMFVLLNDIDQNAWVFRPAR